MQVALHVVHCLQFAARVEQTADDNVTEQPVSDGSIANSVVERPEYQLWASHLHLCIVQTADKAVYHVLLFIYMRQRRPFLLLNEGRCLLHQLLQRRRVVGMGGAEGFYQSLLVGLGCAEDKHADCPRFVALLSDKHGAKLARVTHICNSGNRNCLIFRMA